MPEGDTLHKIANRLRPALVGAEVTRFEAPRLVGPRPRAGCHIDAVDAVGKHLMIRFDDGTALQTHLRMTGSWHLYSPGERWQKPAHLARVVIETDTATAVCFSAPVLRSHRGGSEDEAVAHLGPDLCRSDADINEVLERLARLVEPGTEIADVLLDQRIASGIGNVYKSEVLWAERVDPFARIEAVPADVRRRLFATAARLLRANLTTQRRTTVPGGLAVYRKARRPCRRCGTLIRVIRRGEHARSTYWCPTCQPTAASGRNRPASATLPRHPGGVQEDIRSRVDSEWETRLGVSRSLLRSGGVQVVTADLGANDAMSFRFDQTCIIVVPPHEVESARATLSDLDADAAFTAETLRNLVAVDARVDGPSWHSYADARSFRGGPDPAAQRVDGDDPALLPFLANHDLAEWAESGFPRHPASAESQTNQFWILREAGRVVAAGNLTEWRGVPADVGVLTDGSRRGHGLAGRLVGAMVAHALPNVGIVRYRALESNITSLAVARKLGFEPYGQNFRARRRRP